MRNLWYVSPSRDGWHNLAMDEWFLDHLGPEDVILYFYINQPAVIIGKNQNPWKECDLNAMERDGVRLVRRITGGGAVYHDEGNLNFSFIAGEGRYDVERQLNLILQAVGTFGIPCEFSGRNDLLADGKKFSGNAFCARGSLRQHHGTLLLRSDLGRLQNYLQVDPRKMKAKGVSSVRSRVCNLSEFTQAVTVDAMLAAIRKAYEQTYGPVTAFSPTAEQMAQMVPYYEKQSSWQWRLGKTPAFDLELDPRFPWGGVQMLLTLKDGHVAQAQVYSDAIDAELADEIAARLTGCRFRSQELSHALLTSPKAQLRDVAAYILEQNL
ncbi:MAG: lipoate--protein ligase [Clostridia bacterium]|nr:lipoate--protein ligase [Clostridia bacterium]